MNCLTDLSVAVKIHQNTWVRQEKCPSINLASLNSASKQIQHGVEQIFTNPGGVVRHKTNELLKSEDIIREADSRMKRSRIDYIVIIYDVNRKLMKILKRKRL